MSVESGARYIIKNVKGGTVIDLNGSDGRTLIGFPEHGGENQQWELERTDEGWHVKSVATGQYWALDGDIHNPQNGSALIVSDSPSTFHFWDDEQVGGAIRISVPNSKKDVDLSDHGNAAPGTPIAVWGRWEGQNQLWYFQRV